MAEDRCVPCDLDADAARVSPGEAYVMGISVGVSGRAWGIADKFCAPHLLALSRALDRAEVLRQAQGLDRGLAEGATADPGWPSGGELEREPEMTTWHVLRHGFPLCGFSKEVPREWPEGHRWCRPEEVERIDPEKGRLCTGCKLGLTVGGG